MKLIIAAIKLWIYGIEYELSVSLCRRVAERSLSNKSGLNKRLLIKLSSLVNKSIKNWQNAEAAFKSLQFEKESA